MTPSTNIQLSITGLSSDDISFDVEAFIHRILSLKDITSGQFDFNFVSPEHIHSVNRTYLKHDYVTDIISFNLGSTESIVGDVYICLEKAREQAATYHHSLDDELKLLLVHGILHLLDYTDYTDKDSAIMKQEEQRLLLEADL